MSPARFRQVSYLIALVVVLALWTAYGNSTAIEAPYVGF